MIVYDSRVWLLSVVNGMHYFYWREKCPKNWNASNSRRVWSFINFKKNPPFNKKNLWFFSICVIFLNFLVLIVIKLHAPIIIVIEQQGTRKPGSIPSACNYKISHLHQLKRDNSKLSYSISRVTLPGPQREYYPPPPVFSPSFPFSPKPTKSKASPPTPHPPTL